MATERQLEYLQDLIARHPNFIDTYGYDLPPGADQYTAWISEKYNQYLNNQITSLEDLDSEEASSLITHLQLGERERDGI